MTYFPSEVTCEDGSSHAIESRIYPLPNFEGTSPCAVQQGYGMLMIKADEKEEKATAGFLKRFTDEKQNLRFAINSGYLPVKREDNSDLLLERGMPPISKNYGSPLDSNWQLGFEFNTDKEPASYYYNPYESAVENQAEKGEEASVWPVPIRELQEELETLLQFGVELFQGFYIARPELELRLIAPYIGEKLQKLSAGQSFLK